MSPANYLSQAILESAAAFVSSRLPIGFFLWTRELPILSPAPRSAGRGVALHRARRSFPTDSPVWCLLGRLTRRAADLLDG